MRHYSTKLKPKTDHWAVSWTGSTPQAVLGIPSTVLVQVQENGNQARIELTPEEAEAMALLLVEFATKTKMAEPLPLFSPSEQKTINRYIEKLKAQGPDALLESSDFLPPGCETELYELIDPAKLK